MDTALVAREDEMVGRTPQTSSPVYVCACACFVYLVYYD